MEMRNDSLKDVYADARATAFADSILLWLCKRLPHTLNCLEFGLYLISDANLQHLDRMTVAAAILPHILYHFEQIMCDVIGEADETNPARVIMDVRNCLCYTSWSAFIFHSVMAISTILSTPGLGAKAFVAIDLFIESLLCWMAKSLFFAVLRLLIHELLHHERLLWLFDPVFVELEEEDVEDFARDFD